MIAGVKQRIALFADVHVGNHRKYGGPLDRGINRRCLLVLDTLERGVGIAKQRGAQAVISLGDLFDSLRPTPQVVAAVQRIVSASGLPWYFLRGNHEMASEARRDTALEALAPVGTVVDAPTVIPIAGVNVVFAPYLPGDAAAWVPQQLRAAIRAGPAELDAQGFALAVSHVGLKDVETPPWLQNAKDSIHIDRLARELAALGIPAFAAGNWHDRRSWQIAVPSGARAADQAPLPFERLQLVQVGTLAPARFGEEGPDFGWCAVFDAKRGDGALIDAIRVPGPRFHTVASREHAVHAVEQVAKGDALFLRMRCKPADKRDLRAWFREFQTITPQLYGFEFQLDVDEEIRRARSSARAASSPETMLEALERCVREKVTIPEGIDRDEVLVAARRYLEC